MHRRLVSTQSSEDVLRDVWPMLLRAARVLVPSTLLVSLFYYFGLRYTDDHYRQYGLDDAALGYSSVDYVVRSLNVMVEPARVVAIAVLVAISLHVALTAGARTIERRRLHSDASVTRVAGLVLFAAGLVGMYEFWSSGRATTDQVRLTGGWLISGILVTYGAHLAYSRPRRPRDRTPHNREGTIDRDQRRWLTSLVVAMLMLLVAQGAFDFTRAYARDRAYRESRRIEANPWWFPLVRIYSTIDLALDDQLQVPESQLDVEVGAYRYRYDNLRLFIQDNGRIVLWPANRSPRAGMFILTESADLRVEYLPQRQP
jgi:hypothetical protein